MGMRCYLKQISPELLEEMQSNPAMVSQMILSGPTQLDDLLSTLGINTRDPKEIKEIMDGLSQQFASMNLPQEFLQQHQETRNELEKNPHDSKGAVKALGLEKAWHGIHFILTGDVWGGSKPLKNVIFADKEIGNAEDFGFGGPRYLTPLEVQEVVNALAEIDMEEFRKRFDLKQMKAADIYGIGGEAEEEEREYLSHYYEKLIAYYKDAAAAGNAMMIYVV